MLTLYSDRDRITSGISFCVSSAAGVLSWLEPRQVLKVKVVVGEDDPQGAVGEDEHVLETQVLGIWEENVVFMGCVSLMHPIRMLWETDFFGSTKKVCLVGFNSDKYFLTVLFVKDYWG